MAPKYQSLVMVAAGGCSTHVSMSCACSASRRITTASGSLAMRCVEVYCQARGGQLWHRASRCRQPAPPARPPQLPYLCITRPPGAVTPPPITIMPAAVSNGTDVIVAASPASRLLAAAAVRKASAAAALAVAASPRASSSQGTRRRLAAGITAPAAAAAAVLQGCDHAATCSQQGSDDELLSMTDPSDLIRQLTAGADPQSMYPDASVATPDQTEEGVLIKGRQLAALQGPPGAELAGDAAAAGGAGGTFRLLTGNFSWQAGQAACKAAGGHLAKYDDYRQQLLVEQTYINMVGGGC
jgi:hypothetical protein